MVLFSTLVKLGKDYGIGLVLNISIVNSDAQAQEIASLPY